MFVYRLLTVLFPRSFLAKIVAVSAIGVAVPLAVIGLTNNSLTGDHTIPLILAAIFGTAVTAALFRALLAPFLAVGRTLESYGEQDMHDALPHDFADEAGRTMALTDRLLSGVRAELSISRTAADTDPLTGLLNRRGFDRHRPACDRGSIIFVDLDHFKRVNDTLGHDAGDLVLQATADLLRGTLRENELVARFGGEEFVVFLPDVDLDRAIVVAERIRAKAEILLGTRLGPVTISAGVAETSRQISFAEALTHADRAVYAAKRLGRNRVCLSQGTGLIDETPVEPIAPAVTAAE